MNITVTEIMDLADMHAHAKITEGTPAEMMPRNLLQHRMQQICTDVFVLQCKLIEARREIASLQARVNECGAGAGCCAQAAHIAEMEAQLEAVGAGGVGPLVAAPAQPDTAKQSPHPEYDKGFSEGWDRCKAQQVAPAQQLPIAMKTSGAWDGLEELMDAPDGTAVYTVPQPSAQAQDARQPLTDAQIASACMSYRHDFGLLDDAIKAQLMDDAREWERALGKEHARATK